MTFRPHLVWIAACLACAEQPENSVANDAGATQQDAGDSTDAGEAGYPVPAPTMIGGERSARVTVPPAYDGRTRLPAVFALPGYGVTATELDEWLDLSSRVERLGFVLVHAEGTRNHDGEPFWNATDTCCDYYDAGVDDDAWLSALRRELLEKIAVDETRLYLLGHSNGAFMAYHLACDHAGEWTALASLAGSMWTDLARCAASGPVNVLQVHGTQDRIMPYAGDDEAPGAEAVLARWQVLNDCEPDRAPDPQPREYVNDVVVQETEIQRAICRGARGVELWKMNEARHAPDFRPSFTDDLLEWLLTRR